MDKINKLGLINVEEVENLFNLARQRDFVFDFIKESLQDGNFPKVSDFESPFLFSVPYSNQPKTFDTKKYTVKLVSFKKNIMKKKKSFQIRVYKSFI